MLDEQGGNDGARDDVHQSALERNLLERHEQAYGSEDHQRIIVEEDHPDRIGGETKDSEGDAGIDDAEQAVQGKTNQEGLPLKPLVPADPVSHYIDEEKMKGVVSVWILVVEDESAYTVQEE